MTLLDDVAKASAGFAIGALATTLVVAETGLARWEAGLALTIAPIVLAVAADWFAQRGGA